MECGAIAPLGGNIIQATTPTSTATYEYDPLDRLTREAGPVQSQYFGYDLGGNRSSD